MGTKSRESIYGASVRASAERAAEARKQADQLACDAWNKRMLAFKVPPSKSNAWAATTHQTVALDVVRRRKTTPVHELERYMRCRQCSELQGYPFKRSHLVALRPTRISANDPSATWWPGER